MTITQGTDSVSALICTRNRPEFILEAVKSVLRCSGPLMELIIVDQSDNDSTRNALADVRDDARLRYVHDPSTGKGTALNLGLKIAASEIVAITDDDCVVPENWVATMKRALDKYPRAAIAYGNVDVPDYDRSTGWIPDYHIRKSRVFNRVSEKPWARGIGANTAVRRRAILEMGGFDNEVGPGGKFRACIDGDMTYRSLLFGWWVVESEESHVIHYGFRPNSAARDLVRNAFYGIGAAYVKPIKRRDRLAIPVLLAEFLYQALLPSLWNTVLLRKRKGWGRVLSFWQGVIEGWKTPMNSHSLTYVVNEAARAVPGPTVEIDMERREAAGSARSSI